MKPGTFTQLYIHLVFAVRNRRALLLKKNLAEIFKYLSGMLTKNKHKSIIVNSVSDHVHILYGMNPAKSISDTVHALKRRSSIHINKHNLSPAHFSWQEGYGAFSYSKSQLNDVYNYIFNQEAHHKKKSFKEEYIDFLKKFEIEYQEKFLFDFLE